MRGNIFLEISVYGVEDVLACYPVRVSHRDRPREVGQAVVCDGMNMHLRKKWMGSGLCAIAVVDRDGRLGFGEDDCSGVTSDVEVEWWSTDTPVLEEEIETILPEWPHRLVCAASEWRSWWKWRGL